ncbi:MAG TPA: NAD-dependent epimerase/dehydratase [Rhizomicrobium sp.]|nr:NAD-dependent epimerase/dehydratase [Rhizomicrobium sp.]
MRRVLLTGASGFLGRPTLAALVAAGFEVHAVARNPPAGAGHGAYWHATDLLNAAARRRLMEKVRPSHLLHLAWYVAHGKFWTAPENETWRAASLELARDFAREGGERMVAAGSCAEYDWKRSNTAAWKESDTCDPATPYGRAKYALYRSLEAEASKLGLSFAWARLFLMFGEGEDKRRLVPSLIDGLLAGKEVALGSPAPLRDFSDTRDIAAMLTALAATDRVVGAVNVASGRGVTIGQVGEIIAELTGASTAQLKFGALPPRGEPSAMVADIGRLGELASRAPLEQRLMQQIALRRGR